MIPKPSHPIADGKPIDRRWYDALSRIAASSLSPADVRAVVDGAIAGTKGADIRIFESSTIDVQGNAGAGFAISLRPLADSGVGAGLWKFTRDSFGRVSGTQSATTDDLAEGVANLYFTDERAQDAVGAAIAAGTGDGVTLSYDDAGNAINAANTDKGSVALQQNTTASYVDGYGFTKTLSMARASDYDDGGVRKVNGGLTARTRFSSSDEYDTEVSGTGLLTYSYDPSQAGSFFNTTGTGLLGNEFSFSNFTISKATKSFTGSCYLTLSPTGMPAAADGVFTSETISVPYASGTMALQETIQMPAPITVAAGATYHVMENNQVPFMLPITLLDDAVLLLDGALIGVC